MSTLLTIDWDSFIPEDPYWDIGHKENVLFATMLWQHRLNLVSEYKLDNLYKTFWNHVNLSNVSEILVSDSHLEAHHILQREEFEKVVLVDAHHDAWEYRENKDDVVVDCASWLRYWLDVSLTPAADWYQPKWAHELFTVPNGLSITHYNLDWDYPYLKSYTPDVVHVCRSGSWSPPWFDKNFVEFVRTPGLNVTDIGNVEYVDPMEIRMTMDEALAGAAEYEKAWKTVRMGNEILQGNADIALGRFSDENIQEKKSA